MKRCKTIKAEEKVIEAFVILSKTEGREQGKMLEILLETFNKQQQQESNCTTF